MRNLGIYLRIGLDLFGKWSWKCQPELGSCSTMKSGVFGNFIDPEMGGDFCSQTHRCCMTAAEHLSVHRAHGHSLCDKVLSEALWTREHLWQNTRLQLGATYSGS